MSVVRTVAALAESENMSVAGVDSKNAAIAFGQ